MSVDGTYKVEVSMPKGKLPLSIMLKTEGNSLNGSIDGLFGKHDFFDGMIKENDIKWTVLLTSGLFERDEENNNSDDGFFNKLGKFFSESFSEFINEPPHPEIKSVTAFPVEFTATVSGDEITGEIRFGDDATGAFSGVRSDD